MSLDNNKPDEDKIKAEALFKLFRERTFLGEIEIEFGKQGREIVRKAVRTSATVVLLILFTIPIMFSICPYPFTALISFLVVCIALVFYIPSIYFHHKLKNIDKRDVSSEEDYKNKIDWVKKNLAEKSLWFRVLWYHPVLVTPFSIRTVWLWTLILGYFRAVKESGIRVNFNFPVDGINDWQVVNSFSEEILKALLVVVVSYITTNIISELLALREAYVKGQSEVGELNVTIGSLSNTLRKENAEIKLTFDKMKLSTSLNNLYQKLKDKKRENPFINVGDEFVRSLNEYIKTYSESFKDKPILDVFTLSALSRYLDLEVKHFREENKLITKFDLFGDIVHCTLEELLQNSKESSGASEIDLTDFEFFTIVVIPPSKFICYDEVAKQNTPNWSNYLITNYKARETLKQQRHFLSVRFEDDTVSKRTKMKSVLSELSAIKSTKVREDLNKNLYLKTDRSSWTDELPIHHEKHEDGAIKFIDPPASENTLYTKVELSKVLKEVFHSGDRCKIIEIKIVDENDIKQVKSLVDVEGGFLLDYYAAKYKGEWFFCYRAKYERSLNTAHIELFHSEIDPPKWENVKKDLDNIFASKASPGESQKTPYKTEIGEVFDIDEYQ